MCSWCKIVCVVNSWNFAVSQCNQSCPVSPIFLDFEYPLIVNKSSVVKYSFCIPPNSSIYHASNFFPDASSPIISFFFSLGYAMPLQMFWVLLALMSLLKSGRFLGSCLPWLNLLFPWIHFWVKTFFV